jgi:glycosyltransferase involved in cell wall biosynthesis
VEKEKVGPSNEKYFLDVLLFGLSLKAAEEFQPDIIHAHLHEGALIGCAVRMFTGIPVLFDLQGSLTGEMSAHGFIKKNTLVHRIFEWIEYQTDQWPDFVVTQAATMRDELLRKFRVPGNRVALTMDGVDSQDFRPGLSIDDLRTRYGLGNAPVVVYLGLLNHYQGVDCLLEAIPQIIREVPETVFLIMGYPDVERYTEMARKLGIPDRNIRFTGRIPYEDAPRYICLGQIAVSPKLGITEANGKLYNYMACGLPTVAFENSINREVLGDAGVYAEMGKSVSLAEGILQLLRNPGLRSALGKLGRTRVVENFSWDAVAKRLLVCYEKVLAERAS